MLVVSVAARQSRRGLKVLLLAAAASVGLAGNMMPLINWTLGAELAIMV